MWNYVFFIAYLRDKDETEYTGIESYVAEKVKNNDTNWFPFNRYFNNLELNVMIIRALTLKHQDEIEGEITKEAIHDFHSEVYLFSVLSYHPRLMK